MRVNEVFESISGEGGGLPQGTWVTVIRLQGCNLTCGYCDAPESQGRTGSRCEDMSIGELLCLNLSRHVLITGGEPLLQEEVTELIHALQRTGHMVQVETNGSIEIPVIPDGLPIAWVIDRKCPGSGTSDKMLSLETLIENLTKVEETNENHYLMFYLKWVVTESDIDFMLNELEVMQKAKGIYPIFLISPVDADGELVPKIIEAIRERAGLRFYKWMERVIISVQIHKLCKMP